MCNVCLLLVFTLVVFVVFVVCVLVVFVCRRVKVLEECFRHWQGFGAQGLGLRTWDLDPQTFSVTVPKRLETSPQPVKTPQRTLVARVRRYFRRLRGSGFRLQGSGFRASGCRASGCRASGPGAASAGGGKSCPGRAGEQGETAEDQFAKNRNMLFIIIVSCCLIRIKKSGGSTRADSRFEE